MAKRRMVVKPCYDMSLTSYKQLKSHSWIHVGVSRLIGGLEKIVLKSIRCLAVPAGDLFAVSVVGCLLGYSSCLVVWIPLFLDPSDGVFGRFDLAALCGCRTLNFFFFFFWFSLPPLLPSSHDCLFVFGDLLRSCHGRCTAVQDVL